MQSRRRGSHRGRPVPKQNKDKFLINREIQAKDVKLIAEDGAVLGVMPLTEALARAEAATLDLVEISGKASPPVCKIFDYSKFIYQREKKRKEAKKHQKTSQLKEIKFRPQTDVHDYNFKVKHIREFLENGDKVKITIRFKGRQLAFKTLGYEKLEKIKADIVDFGKVELQARMEGRTLFMMVAPLRAGVKPRAVVPAKPAAQQAGETQAQQEQAGEADVAEKAKHEPDNMATVAAPVEPLERTDVS